MNLNAITSYAISTRYHIELNEKKTLQQLTTSAMLSLPHILSREKSLLSRFNAL